MAAPGAMVAAREGMAGAGVDWENTPRRSDVAAAGAVATGAVRREAAAEAVGTEATGTRSGTPTPPSCEPRRSLGSHPCAARGTHEGSHSIRSRGEAVRRTGICRRPPACTGAAIPLRLGASRRAGTRDPTHKWGRACPRETALRSAPAARAARPRTRRKQGGGDAWYESQCRIWQPSLAAWRWQAGGAGGLGAAEVILGRQLLDMNTVRWHAGRLPTRVQKAVSAHSEVVYFRLSTRPSHRIMSAKCA